MLTSFRLMGLIVVEMFRHFFFARARAFTGQTPGRTWTRTDLAVMKNFIEAVYLGVVDCIGVNGWSLCVKIKTPSACERHTDGVVWLGCDDLHGERVTAEEAVHLLHVTR